jgi:tetratricopeptide (TPR) repeat protein
MPFTVRMVALHSALWDIDRWYRMAWYVWPAALALLIAGWICVEKPGGASPTSSPWGRPIAATPNFPVHRSPILANWPARLHNDVMTCFNPVNPATLAPQIDACTHVIDGGQGGQVGDPQLANAYNQRGWLQRLSQPDRAIADYDAALKIQPNFAFALTNRAYNYLTRNRYDDAMADLNKAIDLFAPAQASYARYLRGFDYKKQKKYDLALEDLNQSITQAPNFQDAYLERGQVEQAQQQWDAALRDFDEYSRRAPHNARGLIGKSEVLEATGRTPDALSALDAAIAIEPGNQNAITARDRLRAKQAARAPQQPKQDDGKD